MARGGYRILAPVDVAQLRRRRAAGWTARALATAYGVSTRTVYRYLPPETPVPVQARLRTVVARWAGRAGVELTPAQVESLALSVRCVVDHERDRGPAR